MNFISRNMSRLGLGAGQKRMLDALLESPIAVQALAEVEKAEVAERAALVAELSDVHKKFDALCIEASRKTERAEAAVRLAEERLRAAVAEHAAAAAHSMSVSLQKQNTEGTLTMKLEQGADPRLAVFIGHLNDLRSTIRHLPLDIVMIKKPNAWGELKESAVEKLQDGVLEASDAIGRAGERVRAMKLKALTKAEATAALREIADRDLRPHLIRLRLGPPRVLDTCILPPALTDAHAALPGELEPVEA